MGSLISPGSRDRQIFNQEFLTLEWPDIKPNKENPACPGTFSLTCNHDLIINSFGITAWHLSNESIKGSQWQ